jgi:hypothetical protein
MRYRGARAGARLREERDDGRRMRAWNELSFPAREKAAQEAAFFSFFLLLEYQV